MGKRPLSSPPSSAATAMPSPPPPVLHFLTGVDVATAQVPPTILPVLDPTVSTARGSSIAKSHAFSSVISIAYQVGNLLAYLISVIWSSLLAAASVSILAQGPKQEGPTAAIVTEAIRSSADAALDEVTCALAIRVPPDTQGGTEDRCSWLVLDVAVHVLAINLSPDETRLYLTFVDPVAYVRLRKSSKTLLPPKALRQVTLSSTFSSQSRTKSIELKAFAGALQRVAFPHGTGLRVAVIIGPKSGDGKGVAKWERFVSPLLAASAQEVVRATVTTHSGHAQELAMEIAAAGGADVILAVGGDGMVHEVINGIVAARSKRKSTTGGEPRVALVPAGSGCALAKELDVLAPVDAVLGVIHARHYHGLDVTRVTVKDVETDTHVLWERYSFMGAMFASMAAVDFESESMRFLGNGRFVADIVGRRVLMGGRLFFHADVEYKPAPCPDDPTQFLDGLRNVSRCCKRRVMDSGWTSFEMHEVSKRSSPDHSSHLPMVLEEDENLASSSSSSAIVVATASEWRKVPQRTFSLLYANSIAYVAQDWLCAPFADGEDGTLELWFNTPDFTRMSWIMGIPEMMSSRFVGNPQLRSAKCTEIRVRSCDGYVSVDGERAPSGMVHFKVLPAAERVQVIGAPRLTFTHPEKPALRHQLTTDSSVAFASQ